MSQSKRDGGQSRREFVSGCAGAVAAVAMGAYSARAAQTASGRTFEVIGYLPEWRVERFDLETTKGLLTETIAFSVEPAADGSIDMRRLPDAVLTRLRDQTKRLGQRMTVSLGGWGRCEHYPAVAADAALRKRHVADCLELCKRFALDGLDIDWEHPHGREQLEQCAALFAETRAALEPGGYIVTSALPHWVELPLHGYEALNRVNLMSYDHEGRHATLEQAKVDVETLLGRGVASGAIALGVPFYGKPFDGRERRGGGSYSQLVERHGAAADQDEIEGVFHNSPGTIAAKTRYALEKGLAGMMIWEITQDIEFGNAKSLLRTIHTTAHPTT